MALKVIGAGFGRTGTLSMKAALEQLGFNKTHHMVEVFPSAFQLNAWHALSQGKTPNWDAIFEGYEASVDFPSSGYWRELADYYPEAKVILTTRSFESWYASAEDTIYPASHGIPGWMNVIPKVKKIREMTNGTIWDRIFDGRFEDKSYAQTVWDRHEADVKAAIPAERLLVFHPKQGWGPLCEFLDKPVPDMPFPNVNDKADFKKRISMLRRMQYMPFLVSGVVIAAAIAAYVAFQ